MASAYVRAPMKSRMVTRFSPDGSLQSLDLDVLADAGAYMGNTKDYMRTLYGKLFRCYRVPYAHYRARIVSSNTPVSGAYRSWSAAEEAVFRLKRFASARRYCVVGNCLIGMARRPLMKNLTLAQNVDSAVLASGAVVTATLIFHGTTILPAQVFP